MAKKTFVKGAIILGVAGVIVKILGAFFRIPLANIIGDTGMGYYQTAYPIYVLLLTLSTAGIPTAIARMVSQRTAEGHHREAYRVFRLSFILLLAIGSVSCAVLFFGADLIVGLLHAPKAAVAMRAIAPALIFVPMMSAFRGYFQGRQDMSPTAVSQIFEQLARVTAGLVLAMVLLPLGLNYAAAGASFGAAAGGIGGLVVILIIYARRRKQIRLDCEEDARAEAEANGLSGDQAGEQADGLPVQTESAGSILKTMLLIAVPITIGAAIMPIMSNIDLVLVMNRLTHCGFSAEDANDLYGQLSGFAVPVINLPQVITQSVALSLVPAVAAAHQVGDLDFMRKNIVMGLRAALIVGLPCGLGILVLAKPLMVLLYPNQYESAVSASGCLAVMAVGVIFLSTVQILTGMLQGIGKQMIPVKNLFIGAIAKVIITYVLTGIPSINIKGAAAGTVAAYVIASYLNLRAVKKYTGAEISIRLTYIKPLISAAIMAAGAAGVYALCSLSMGNALSTLIAVGWGVVIYCLLIFATGAITQEELSYLPKGEKLVALADKLNRK